MGYFALSEDLEAIAGQTFSEEKIQSAQQITTGWTNIVLEVETDQDTYIFRFPRDEFWAQTIEKDAELAQFVHGKTSFRTVNPELIYDSAGRPFTKHRRLEGVPLAEEFDKLNPNEVKNIAAEIAQFLYELHQIEFALSEVFPRTDFGQNIVDFLDQLLRRHLEPGDFAFWDYEQLRQSGKSHLVHGDLNTSNILLTPDHHIAAILDFGFGGTGDKYFDLSRLVSRAYPEGFAEALTASYGKLSGEELDIGQLRKTAELWRKIDQAYIDYMTKIGIYHPTDNQ